MKTKALISFAVTAKLICVFVFAYAKSRVFSLRGSYNSYHGGEARDLKLEIPGTPPTVRICISLIFFIYNGRICIMLLFADNLKKCTKTSYLNGFLEK